MWRLLMAIAVLGTPLAAIAQEAGEAMLMINRQPVLAIAPAGQLSAETRAMVVRDRIRSILAPSAAQSFRPVGAQDVNVATSGEWVVVRLRDQDLITVTHVDAARAGLPIRTLAERWADELAEALSEVRLDADQKLPENFVTVTAGGGAGTGMPVPIDPQDLPIDQNQPPIDRPF